MSSSTISKPTDVSFLISHGYSFGAKVGGTSVAKAKFGETNLACKIVSEKSFDIDAIKMLNHQHIIPVHSILQNSSCVAMFLQWTDSGNIMNHLRTLGAIKEGQAKFWFNQIVSAIKYLHQRDLAHCSLRCDDLLICKENLKVSGLDKIRRCNGDQKILIKHSDKMYKFYLSPEVNNRELTDPRKCDVYALGSILFMMLNLKIPFNDIDDAAQLYKNQMKRRYYLTTSNVSTLSVDCQVVIHTLLEPNQDIRYGIDKIQDLKWFEKFQN